MEKVVVTVGMTERNYSGYIIISDGIVVSTGNTFGELKKQMKEAVEFHLEGMREDGDEIPEVFNSDYELVYRFDPSSSGAIRSRKKQIDKIKTALPQQRKELFTV